MTRNGIRNSFHNGSLVLVLLLFWQLSHANIPNRDHAIASVVSPIYLDGLKWMASNQHLNIAIPAAVPGDLITDLQRANIISDPYYELNWIHNASLWNQNKWTYTTNFTISSSTSNWILVFDGIKMGARVSVNGYALGVTQSQFQRYTFELDETILFKDDTNNNNTLQVTFDNTIDEEGRFMACTGGWDWAPYSYTYNKQGMATFSKGIWKSVYLLSVPTSVAIEHVTPHVKYVGKYPTERLSETDEVLFDVNVTVHLWTPYPPICGRLQVRGDWENGTTTSERHVLLDHTSATVSLSLQARSPALWWPTGMGSQPLYHVTTTWCSDNSAVPVVSTTRRIGFRVFALVTTNDTHIENNGSSSNSGNHHGMFFRVNGVPLYSRGANVVPMEELEGRHPNYRLLVKSAVDARMNTLRVWGGGIYLPSSFYDACDDYGILLYHDVMYAGINVTLHGPNATSVVHENELRHQIRRLSHHPSIVMWDGVNEVVVEPDGPSSIFSTFVMTIVAQEDQSRAIWPSSPAQGWTSGVDPWYKTPTLQEPLRAPGGGHIWDQGIETHAPYQLGSGWPVVNGGDDDTCWDRWHLVHVPPVFDPTVDFGINHPNVYASEFGVTGSPSFESLSATLSEEHWGLHGGAMPDDCTGPCQGKRQCTQHNPMTQRNYACDAGIRLWFMSNTEKNSRLSIGLNDTGRFVLQAQTYLCQLVQALDEKVVIEERRGKNQFGHLVWMLNDIWPSISWGSLEYSHGPGQLEGGRWNPLHYLYRQSLFADVVATCGKRHRSQEWICYIKNDRAGLAFHGTVTLTTHSLSGSTTPTVLFHKSFMLSEGPGTVEWFAPPTMSNLNTTIVVCTVKDSSSGSIVSEHVVTLTYPKYLLPHLPQANITTSIMSNHHNSNHNISIHVTSDRVALWVVLTSAAHGRFSDNCFFLGRNETKVVQFVPFVKSNQNHEEILIQTLRVEHLSMYTKGSMSNDGEQMTMSMF